MIENINLKENSIKNNLEKIIESAQTCITLYIEYCLLVNKNSQKVNIGKINLLNNKNFVNDKNSDKNLITIESNINSNNNKNSNKDRTILKVKNNIGLSLCVFMLIVDADLQLKIISIRCRAGPLERSVPKKHIAKFSNKVYR